MGYDDYGAGYAYGFLGVYFFAIFLLSIAGYLLSAWFLMKIFDKAGVQGRWRAWVPLYNMMVFFKLGDVSPWLVFGWVIAGIPFIGWIAGIGTTVMSILAAYRIGQKLQKDGAWVVLYIFLSLVWEGINAFDSSRWNANIPPSGWASNSFFADRTVWQGIPVQAGAAPAPGYGAPYGGYPAQQGYPAQPGYGAPQPGYPAQPGYAAPQQPGYGVPQVPGAPGPAPAAPGAPVPPPATPPAAPVPPTAPPAAPPAPPVPPAPPAGDEPPAAPGPDAEPPAGPAQPPA